MEYEFAAPFTGSRLAAVRSFLERYGLAYDENAEFTVNAVEDGEIYATGSVGQNVIKCVAVSQDRQGEGLAVAVVSRLVTFAANSGKTHLFVFTKPHNRILFSGLGFYSVTETADILLMENRKNGIRDFVLSCKQDGTPASCAGVVVNCNPFTLGHQYLIEQAASRYPFVYVFVVSEDKSFFTAADRLDLVKKGTSHLKNVAVRSTSDYLISSVTFPTYFIKEKANAAKLNCELDITIFARCFCAPLSITCRFAGTEPSDAVTAFYNAQMAQVLPRFGIEFIEIPRKENDSQPVSASLVRRLFAERNFEAIKPLVPPTTLEFLRRLAEKSHNA